MAKISLRDYHREIETLIERGEYDEAVVHCKHILKTYPKCLDTYRLIGKAFLEAHRYPEAEDIFKRLLLAIPDDFIGNLGMSLIYDDAGSLSNAIWHMERAFEIQPSNAAVQGELRRLYGRRDGLEPPQIRLTRGALAQMYARGNQIQQAVAEIRSILAEDPERTDMQVLLARVQFRGGQKVEATDTCTSLLKRYPYCLDANRIMVELMTDASRADSTQIYRHRVDMLDPYSKFVPGSLFAVSDVPNNAVNIERLDIDALSQEEAIAADMGTLAGTAVGVSLTAEGEPAPLTGGQTSEQEPLPREQGGSEIPDWLKAAGWGAVAAEAGRRTGAADDLEHVGPTADAEVAEELPEAEMPDWLKSMAPAVPPAGGEGAAELHTAEPDLDWLAGLEQPSEVEASSETERTQASSAGLTAAAVAAAAAAIANRETEEESPEKASPQEVLPAESGSLAESMPPAESESEGGAEPSSAEAALPEWMQEPADRSAGELPGLGALAAGVTMAAAAGDEESSSAGATKTEQGRQEASPEVPGGLAPVSEAGATSADSSPAPLDQMSEDEAFAWLESLAAKQGVNPEELLTTPEERAANLEVQPSREEPEQGGVGGKMAAGAAAAAIAAGISDSDETDEVTPAGVPLQAAPETFEEDTTSGYAPEQSAAEDLSWLEGIEREEGADEAAEDNPPASAWVPAEPLDVEQIPGLSVEEEVEPTTREASLSTEEAAAALAPPMSEEELAPIPPVSDSSEEMPDWLKAALEETPGLSDGEAPPDWMAAAAITQPALRAAQDVAEPEPLHASREAGPPGEQPPVGIEIAREIPPEGDQAVFEQAQIDLQRGNLDQAAAGYASLIKRGKMLDEAIFDLREGTYRHPVDVVVWLTLGDAYKRAGRLQEALDAYTKAEELLR
jgi:tetratricopeptide (TPR) repeat protein